MTPTPQLFRSASHPLLLLLLLLLAAALLVKGDDYSIDPNHKSLLIAAGCFWCAEQAFEQYAPGVVEAVSGYAGAEGIANPTYRNHPGHHEVILIEYNPNLTSYEVMVEYAWRNLDPFDGGGQFCDRGFSYYPAIFYANEEERDIAERVKAEVLQTNPSWNEADLAVPLLERPKFWTAEGYHQNYYLTNPRNYGFYKERCGRTKRLKTVWGEDEYLCYLQCFNGTSVNEAGDEVEAAANLKNAPEESAPALMPAYAVVILSLAAALVGCTLLWCVYRQMRSKKEQSS
ncbi:hypothetical protein ACHAXT_006477 [Thalassiosira profunda]